MRQKVLIIGGGASGMLASIFAARRGYEVCVYEKNDKLGRKLFITGKGRCNITNAGDMEKLFQSVVSNSKFLYSSFYGYSNQDVISFFEELKVVTKIERGNRVFPASDKSSDVIRALEKEMRMQGVQIYLNQEVGTVHEENGKFAHLIMKDNTKIKGDACIIASGGCSYPLTGSVGDGYLWGEDLGHTVVPHCPSLVPMEAKEEFVKEMQGLSLRNVKITIFDEYKEVYQAFGEMVFTHYGVSGPIILDASAYIGAILKNRYLRLVIDLKPALCIEELDQRILREFQNNQNKQFKNVIGKLFPAKLRPVLLQKSGIIADKKINMISKEERTGFARLVKEFTLTLTGLRSYEEAIITKGGIHVKEVNPKTMESKKVKNIFFVGEVLDVDALTGGYNLQIAWSTAYAAGTNVLREGE